MMAPIHPECAWRVGATLEGGAVWHAALRCVAFVDIRGRRLHRYDPHTDARRSWVVPDQIGFALPNANGNWACGVQGDLYRFGFASDVFSRTLPVETGRPGNRPNDGHVDRTGALWFDSMDDMRHEASGQFYYVGRDDRLSVRDSGYVITNDPTASPDSRTLYYTNALQRVVYALDLGDGSSLEHKCIFVSINGSGCPDDTAVDEKGCVWVALLGGGRIKRFSPDGQRIERVNSPCSNIAKFMFGGGDLRTVYTTTTRKGLTGEALLKEPLVGGLFVFRASVKGLLSVECIMNFPATMID